MTCHPLFSVVIPTYNQAQYLKLAIDSVLAQTYTDFEIIVVNNYSTDGTREVVDTYDDTRLSIIDFANHGIIGAARNVGIKTSHGQLVAFLDSDDTWYPNKLEEVARVFKVNPNVGLICHNQDMVRDGIVEHQTNYGPPENYINNMYDYVLQASNGPSTSATTVTRKHLESVTGFSENPDFITVEDYELWLRLAQTCTFHFIKAVLGAHTFHGESSSQNAERLLHGGLAVLSKIAKELEEPTEKLSHPQLRRRLQSIRFHRANAYFVAGRNYHRRGELRKPFEYYRKALAVHFPHRKALASLVLLLADRLIGTNLRRKLSGIVWRSSWRWG